MPARHAVRVSCTVAAGACSDLVTSGSDGRYMSMASGGVAVSPPSTNVTRRPVRRRAAPRAVPDGCRGGRGAFGDGVCAGCRARGDGTGAGAATAVFGMSPPGLPGRAWYGPARASAPPFSFGPRPMLSARTGWQGCEPRGGHVQRTCAVGDSGHRRDRGGVRGGSGGSAGRGGRGGGLAQRGVGEDVRRTVRDTPGVRRVGRPRRGRGRRCRVRGHPALGAPGRRRAVPGGRARCAVREGVHAERARGGGTGRARAAARRLPDGGHVDVLQSAGAAVEGAGGRRGDR